MKYLNEVTEELNVIIEDAATPGAPKKYYIEGIFIQADIKNRNGRVYPLDIVTNEVNRYKTAMIETKRSLGELGHPDTGGINLHLASHLITELRQEGKNFIGKALILDTPNGQIVKNFIDAGVKLGVSTRGFGSVKMQNGSNVVGKDFHLSTVDIVADPSAPNAFVSPMMESKDFTLHNGQIVEVNEETKNSIIQDHLKNNEQPVQKPSINESELLTKFESLLEKIQ